MEVIYEIVEALWEYKISFIPVFIILNGFIMVIGGTLFGMGLAGYMRVPAEFELEVKQSLAISTFVHDYANSVGLSQTEADDMIQILISEGNNKNSPPEDWPYYREATWYYEQAEYVDPIPVPLFPLITSSQVWWIRIGSFLLAVSSLLPLLNSRAVALPVFFAIVIGYATFVYGFNSFGADEYRSGSRIDI